MQQTTLYLFLTILTEAVYIPGLVPHQYSKHSKVPILFSSYLTNTNANQLIFTQDSLQLQEAH